MRGVVGLELDILRDARLGAATQWHYSDAEKAVADGLIARGLLCRVEDVEGFYYDVQTEIGRRVLAASEARL